MSIKDPKGFSKLKGLFAVSEELVRCWPVLVLATVVLTENANVWVFLNESKRRLISLNFILLDFVP
jgi:hypothetical protein